MIIPLFSLAAANATGFNGFERGLAGLDLRRQVNANQRDDYRDSLQFQGELDTLQRFAAARQNNVPLEQSALGALNPFASQSLLNLSVAQAGGLERLNAISQVNPNVNANVNARPLSDFAAQSPSATQLAQIAQQQQQLNAPFGDLSLNQQAQAQQQPTVVVQTNPAVQPAAEQYARPAPVVAQQQSTVQTAAPQTQIQQNAAISAQIQQAIANNTQSAESEQRRENAERGLQNRAVTSPTNIAPPINRTPISNLFSDNFLDDRDSFRRDRADSLFNLINFA